MLASFELGDTHQIRTEDEFIHSLNRFNVTASRARAKFVALLSREFADHLPRQPRVLEMSWLFKHSVDGFLRRSAFRGSAPLNSCSGKPRPLRNAGQRSRTPPAPAEQSPRRAHYIPDSRSAAPRPARAPFHRIPLH